MLKRAFLILSGGTVQFSKALLYISIQKTRKKCQTEDSLIHHVRGVQREQQYTMKYRWQNLVLLLFYNILCSAFCIYLFTNGLELK